MDIFTLLANDSNAIYWSLLTTIWRVCLVLLGINALIIVHEFGHFIAARLCGVRCEKFYIWFDAWGVKLFKFRWGDTEYGLGWLPLGGYVKMLGQEDNPGGMKAEIEKAKQKMEESKGSGNGNDADSVDSAVKSEIKEKEQQLKVLEESLYSPDSYLAKSVPQRMFIISAGVIMNILFAIVCATVAILIGFPETASRIGVVLPGAPAWVNGLRPGDQVVAINGNPVERFAEIQVSLMGGKETTFTVKRSGVEEPVEIKVQPQLATGGMMPTIGITPAASLELARIPEPYRPSLSLEENEKIKGKMGALTGGDLLVEMNGQAVNESGDYERLARKLIAEPITYTFAPSNPATDGSVSRKSMTLDPLPIKETGIRLQMGEITAIQKGSPAEKASLKAAVFDEQGNQLSSGDIILDVNNEPVLDPVKLPYQLFQLGKQGGTSSIVLTVRRGTESVEVPITLNADAGYSGVQSYRGDLAVGQLGVAYRVEPVIGGIDQSVTIDEGNPIGAVIKSVTINLSPPDNNAPKEVKELYQILAGMGKISDNTIRVSFGPKSESQILVWFTNYLRFLPVGTPIAVEVVRDDKTTIVKTAVRNAGDMFLIDRGLEFGVETTLYKTDSLVTALGFGWNKTVEMMGLVFKFLGNVGKTVSAKALGGPGMIVGAAWAFTQRSDGLFLLFLCMLGANLAVVNFLPIPVLDGGHFVFLLYEAITGRQPNENIQIILSYLGLFLVLALMIWVIGLDISRFIFG